MTKKKSKKIDWEAKYHRLFIKYLALKRHNDLVKEQIKQWRS